MRVVADYLRARGALWFHPFNEGRRPPYVGRYLKTIGLTPGVPDVVVIEAGGGIAIELKRVKGRPPSETQAWWLEQLRARGWRTHVAYGADDAIAFLAQHMVTAET